MLNSELFSSRISYTPASSVIFPTRRRNIFRTTSVSHTLKCMHVRGHTHTHRHAWRYKRLSAVSQPKIIEKNMILTLVLLFVPTKRPLVPHIGMTSCSVLSVTVSGREKNLQRILFDHGNPSSDKNKAYNLQGWRQ